MASIPEDRVLAACARIDAVPLYTGKAPVHRIEGIRLCDCQDSTSLEDEWADLQDMRVLVFDWDNRCYDTFWHVAQSKLLPSLNTLVVYCGDLRSPGFQRLLAERPLESVFLQHAYIGSDGMTLIAAIPQLSRLCIVAPESGITDFAAFRNHAALRDLTVLWADLTDAAFLDICSISGLQRLAFDGRVSNTAFASIANLPGLLELRVTGPSMPITDEGIGHLASLRRLQVLDLRGTSVTNDGVKYLTALRDLQRLDLSYAEIDDDALQSLYLLQHLRVLKLNHTGISVAGLRRLGHLRHLEELRVNETGLDDAAIPALSQFEELRVLSVAGCRFSAEGLKRLRIQHPNTTILDNYADVQTMAVAETEAFLPYGKAELFSWERLVDQR